MELVTLMRNDRRRLGPPPVNHLGAPPKDDERGVMRSVPG